MALLHFPICYAAQQFSMHWHGSGEFLAMLELNNQPNHTGWDKTEGAENWQTQLWHVVYISVEFNKKWTVDCKKKKSVYQWQCKDKIYYAILLVTKTNSGS